MRRISVAQPALIGREREYVNQCLDRNQLSGGEFVDRFEQAFARFANTGHAIACSNGTAALHLALAALGVLPGQEIIVPTLTFVATANAARYCGAKPVFVDSDRDYWCIDPALIERKITKRTAGIIAVHLYGHPADMDAINDIAERYGLFVIEDAAEAHGAYYKNRGVGGLGDAGCFSFYGNKVLTTGEGGMVVTNLPNVEAMVRKLRGQGFVPDNRYWFDVMGFNYRMTDIQAAIGLAQVEDWHRHIQSHWLVADWYHDRLAGRLGITMQHKQSWAGHAHWMVTVVLNKPAAPVIAELDRRGIETRRVFYPMHQLPMYRDGGSYPVADWLSEFGLSLPTHAGLSEGEVDRVCGELLEAIYV